MLEPQTFLQIVDVVSGYWQSKSGVNNGPRANQYKFSTSTVSKNVVKKFMAIALLLKELMILLKGAKCNFI